MFGRIGGEEFASVLVNLDKEKVLNIAERIRAAFDHITIKDSGHTIDLDAGVSIGVADTDIATDTVESALKRADSAMYQAKDQGRNRVVFRAL